jgi:hypothetical protein
VVSGGYIVCHRLWHGGAAGAGVEQVGEVTETAGVAHIGVWSVVCRFGGFESEYWGGREVIDTAIYISPAGLPILLPIVR